LKRSCFLKVVVCSLAICLLVSLSLSAAPKAPKGKALAKGNPHRPVPPPLGSIVNPAGIIVGSGGIKTGAAGPHANPAAGSVGANNAATATGPVGFQPVVPGNSGFLGQLGSNVIVKLNSQYPQSRSNVAAIKVAGGKKFLLAAGDAFSGAIADVGASANGRARGHQWQGPDFNPGGGPDKNGADGIGDKGWGTGNKGNGVGNTWVGNQGKGRGGGMAGGTKDNPTDPPPTDPPPTDPPPTEPPPIDPPNPPEQLPVIEPAPLPQTVIPALEEESFEEGGCRALMAWLAGELGIPEETIQVYLANAFATSTDIQPCEACARLYNMATLLADEELIAALEQVINEFVGAPAPPSEEQFASIAAALQNSDGGTRYAAAGQWTAALTEYVRILSAEMGWSEAEAVAFANKYATPVMEGDNIALAAYMQALMTALGG
jgi:hypothetical protein